MYIKIKKWFYILEPRNLTLICGIFVVSAVWLIIEKDIVPCLVAFFALSVAVSLFNVLKAPSEVAVSSGEIRYKKRRTMDMGNKKIVSFSEEDTYTITDINTLVLKQNAIERMINLGHIVVMGECRVSPMTVIYMRGNRHPHVIYGIPNFDGFRQELGEYIQCEGR